MRNFPNYKEIDVEYAIGEVLKYAPKKVTNTKFLIILLPWNNVRDFFIFLNFRISHTAYWPLFNNSKKLKTFFETLL